jgi:hypothetical protein
MATLMSSCSNSFGYNRYSKLREHFFAVFATCAAICKHLGKTSPLYGLLVQIYADISDGIGGTSLMLEIS